MIEATIAVVALTLMEIVLGIDNIVFISIITGKLPKEQRPKARFIGLAAALITRILLLFSITWVMGLTAEAFRLESLGIPLEWFSAGQEINVITYKDLVMLVGGLFLIVKSVQEIHEKVTDHHEAKHEKQKQISFKKVIFQIAMLDIIFSLDSVITAVGMAKDIWVMVTAVIVAIGVMMIFARPISSFVERNPTVKMLALSFLILIGVMLVADGAGTHIGKGYIYFAMCFALLVEMLNLRVRPSTTIQADVEDATTPESS